MARRNRTGAIVWIIYLGVTATALGFATCIALRPNERGPHGSLTYLIPLVAIMLGWAVLGETPPWLAHPEASCAWPGSFLPGCGVRVLADGPMARSYALPPQVAADRHFQLGATHASGAETRGPACRMTLICIRHLRHADHSGRSGRVRLRR